MTTSYSNLGGTGSRTWITATMSGLVGGCSPPTALPLVDGSYSNGCSTATAWGGSNTAGEIKFDFPEARVIDAFKWYQSGTANNGTWKWAGSNDDSTYTDLLTGFTLGGATSPVEYTYTNTTGYRYYKLIQTGGTTSGSDWVQEIEFKIDPAPSGGPTTWNPYDKNPGVLLSSGNLRAQSVTPFGTAGVRAGYSASAGKLYFETYVTANDQNYYSGVGVTKLSQALNDVYGGAGGFIVTQDKVVVNGSNVLSGLSTGSHTICIATDLDNQRVWVRVDGGYWNGNATYDPATNTGGLDISGSGSINSQACAPLWCSSTSTTNNIDMTANFVATAYAQTPPTGFGNWAAAPSGVTGTWASTEAVDTSAATGTLPSAPSLDSPVGNTHSSTLSYTSAGLVNILVLWVWNDGSTTTAVSSPTYGSFTKRATLSHVAGYTQELTEWWVAVASGAGASVSSEVISITTVGGPGLSMIAAGVKGCSSTAPFDTSGSFPATINSSGSSAPTATGINSTSSLPLVGGLVGTASNTNLGSTPGTSFTYDLHEHSGNGPPDSDLALEHYAPGSALSGFSATWGTSYGEWAFLVDAFAPPPPPAITGTCASTETKDALAFVGGVLGGSWHSTEGADAMSVTGGVLGGSWHSTEADDVMDFIGHPELYGIWESTEAVDAMTFHDAPQGAWDSTEAKDAMAIAGGVLGGSWHSTEADDAIATLGGADPFGTMAATEAPDVWAEATFFDPYGSWHSTDTPDAWASDVVFPPYGALASTEVADLMSSTGTVPPHGTWASVEGADTLATTGDVLATFFDPATASWGIDFQALDLTIINQLAFGQTVGAKSNTTRSTGKYYAEFTTRFSAANSGVGIGNALATFDGWGNSVNVGPGNGPAASGAACFSSLNGTIWIDGVQQSNWSGTDTLYNAIVRVAIDLDNNLIWFSVNGGHWNGLAGANPALGIASPRPPSNQPQEISGGYDISAVTAHGPIYLWAELVSAYDAATLNPGNSAFAYSVPSGFAAWDVAAPINIPLQMDGYATSDVHGTDGGITLGTVTLSTTQDDDVIVLGVSTGGFWTCGDVDHVTSSSGLVWKRRNKRWQSGGYKQGSGTVISQGLDTEIWWAHAPVALTGEVITVHMTRVTGGMGLVAFGVSGANYTTPWDKHTLAGGYVDPGGGGSSDYYFPPTSSLYTKARNAFLFGFHGGTAADAGVAQAPWTYVTSALGTEPFGYGDFLSLVYQVVEEPQFNTNVVVGSIVSGIGTIYTASSMMFDSIVAADEAGTDKEIVWFWDSNSVTNVIQLSTGRTLQLSYSAVNYNLMVIIEVAIMSASGTGTVSSISEAQGSLSSSGFERRSRTVTSTPLGPLAVEIWWGWMPMYTAAERPNNDTITINTANTAAGDIIGATMLGLGGTTGAFGLGDPFWDINPAVPSKNSNSSGSPPPYATDISTTIPSELVVAWTANNTHNVPGFTEPFVTLVQRYPSTIVPIMQLNSVAPPLYTGFEFYYEPGLATSETAEFLQSPEPNGWIVIADAIPVGPPQPPSGTMHISDPQDKFTHTGDYSTIGIASPGGWVGLLPLYATMTMTEREDICGGTPNLGYSPFLGEGWLGWVMAQAAWNSTESHGDAMAAYGWVIGFGITGQLNATGAKDRLAFSNRATVTGTMGAVETPDRWASAGIVLPAAHVHPKAPVKRRLLIVT